MNTNPLGYSTNPFKLSQIVSKSDPNQKIQPPIDQSSDYLNSLINQYTNEIYLLKRTKSVFKYSVKSLILSSKVVV